MMKAPCSAVKNTLKKLRRKSMLLNKILLLMLMESKFIKKLNPKLFNTVKRELCNMLRILYIKKTLQLLQHSKQFKICKVTF